MKKIKISSFPGKDNKNFKNINKIRNKIINKTSATPINNEYIIDRVGKNLYPKIQRLVVKNIVEENKDIKTFYFANADAGTLAIFRPGQYITLLLNIDGKFLSRPHSLSSSPNEAINGVYRISVKRVEGGIASNYMLDNVKIGDIIESLHPSGELYPSSIRDKKHIVALASGIGISPFVSIAKAIHDKTLDKELTIFYSVNYINEFVYAKELKELANKNNNIKVVFVSKEENEDGIENGLITVDLIKSYVTSKFTVFAAGYQDFYDYLKKELTVLNLGDKDFRFESSPTLSKPIVISVPQASVITIAEEKKTTKKSKSKKKEEEEEVEEVTEVTPEAIVLPKIYNIKVFHKEEEYNIPCFENQTILSALEEKNIKARSKCRSGECGYCRSLLLWGNIRVDKDKEHRRSADIKYNYIHPCSSYPTSDITIKIDI
ncbi:MAG: 2Fe-2S iron-sulfur cluster binding domain-containing protein [Tenericutes bacterium]|nr:2Fe-2S iron-sulfur cluster binding domain-containing protein [Mycoplasmatota bacterium]